MRGKPTIVKTVRIDPDEVTRIMNTLAGWRYRYDWTAIVVGALKDAMDTALRERTEIPKLYQRIAEATDLDLLPTEPFDLGEEVTEPEPVQAVEPEPVQAVEPEPVQAVEPEPVQAVEPEPVQAVEPEPVQAVEPEPVQAKVPKKGILTLPSNGKAKGKVKPAKAKPAKAKPTSAKPAKAKPTSAKPAPSKNGTVKKGGKK